MSNTLANIDQEYMTPTVLKAPNALPSNVRVPDNTPVTPEVTVERNAPPKMAEGGDLVNKNLFGTPVIAGILYFQTIMFARSLWTIRIKYDPIYRSFYGQN